VREGGQFQYRLFVFNIVHANVGEGYPVLNTKPFRAGTKRSDLLELHRPFEQLWFRSSLRVAIIPIGDKDIEILIDTMV
jgi:hypothetical protein